MLTTFDGYFYLSLARDLQNGQYDSRDTLRAHPDTVPRPPLPPLLSLMAAQISTIGGISLDWVGVLLPPLLGILLAVPLFLLGRLYGGIATGAMATFIGTCSGYYIYRSSVGWFDTDCMNVTFALMVTYLFLQFGLKRGRVRYGYLAGGCLVAVLFGFWWDQSVTPVVTISMAPLLISAAVFYRPTKREAIAAAVVVLTVAAIVLAWQGPSIIGAFYKKLIGLFGYISKAQDGPFPNIGTSVFEQKPFALAEMVQKTTGSLPAFVIGVLGLGWLFWSRPREAAPLTGLIALGCFSFLYARRFLIFLNPFIALGAGYLVWSIWHRNRHVPYIRIAVSVLAAAICVATARGNLIKVYWPKVLPPIAHGFKTIETTTPESSVVWAWWDHGYPLVYYASRATINDGSVHSGMRTVCNAVPFASTSQAYAAAYMRFYAVHGTAGIARLFEQVGGAQAGMGLIEDILTAGLNHADPIIEKAGLSPVSLWRTFFFPSPDRPLYLFLDLRLARTTYWWHWFGTYDVAKGSGRHPKFKLIRGLEQHGRTIKGPEVEIDLDSGMVRYKGNSFVLNRAALVDGPSVRNRAYHPESAITFAFRKGDGTGALMDNAFTDTVFHQLFMMDSAASPHFEKVAEHYPYYQLYLVSPKAYAP